MKSRTATAADMILACWMKKLRVLHERLAAQIKGLLTSDTQPDWLRWGRTILIIREPHKGSSQAS